MMMMITKVIVIITYRGKELAQEPHCSSVGLSLGSNND